MAELTEFPITKSSYRRLQHFVSFDANEQSGRSSLKVLSDSKAYPIDLTIGNGKLTMSSPMTRASRDTRDTQAKAR